MAVVSHLQAEAVLPIRSLCALRAGTVKLALPLIYYLIALQLFSASMCNPSRPYIEVWVFMLATSAILFGYVLHRRLYRR